MRDVVAEIKARISILDLVSEYVVLKKTGTNYKGLSPFKPEKTPSFVVSPDKGIAYCFATNRGGDIFKFLMEVENIEFAEALKILAEKAGVELQDYRPEQIAEKKNEKQFLLDLHEEVAKFYVQQLWETGEGAKLQEYLQKRGILPETARQFALGLAPDSFDQTHLLLLKKGFDKKQILAAGLAVAKDTSLLNCYDRFRARLMFPVVDSLGRVVGFGGRAILPDQEPKYLNSPETAIYQKSSLLYGFQVTKQAIRESKSVLVVEGYMDFLAAWQNGIKNVVAVNGTALTMRHLTLLKPYLDTLILAFDMDTAGREAVRRAFEMAQDFDWNLRVLRLPGGVKDIAEYCQQSASDLPAVVAGAEYFADYFYTEILNKYGFPEKKLDLFAKKKVAGEFAQLYYKIKSNIEKDQYLKRLATDLGLDPRLVMDDLNALKLTKSGVSKMAQDNYNSASTGPSAEDKFLGMMVEFWDLFKEINLDFEQVIYDESVKTVYKILREKYNFSTFGNSDFSALIKDAFQDLQPQIKDRVTINSLYAREHYGELPPAQIKQEIEGLSHFILNQSKKQRLELLQRKLKSAESQNDSAEVQRLLTELSRLYR